MHAIVPIAHKKVPGKQGNPEPGIRLFLRQFGCVACGRNSRAELE
jgi:hypothetical protein